MLTHEEFLARIEAFLKERRMSPTRFGREAVADPSFVFTLRTGRSPGLKTAERVLAFMAAKPEQEGQAA